MVSLLLLLYYYCHIIIILLLILFLFLILFPYKITFRTCWSSMYSHVLPFLNQNEKLISISIFNIYTALACIIIITAVPGWYNTNCTAVFALCSTTHVCHTRTYKSLFYCMYIHTYNSTCYLQLVWQKSYVPLHHPCFVVPILSLSLIRPITSSMAYVRTYGTVR